MSISSLSAQLANFQAKREVTIAGDGAGNVTKKVNTSLANGNEISRLQTKTITKDGSTFNGSVTSNRGEAFYVGSVNRAEKSLALTVYRPDGSVKDISLKFPKNPDPRPFPPITTGPVGPIASTDPVRFVDDVPIIFVVDPNDKKVDPATVKTAAETTKSGLVQIPGLVYDPSTTKAASIKPDTGLPLPPTRVEYNSIKTVYQAYNTTKQAPGGIGVELPPGPPKTIDEEGTISNAPIKTVRPPKLPPIAEPPEAAPPIDEIGPQTGGGLNYDPTAADVVNGRPPKLPPIVEPDPDTLARKQKIAESNPAVLTRVRPVGPFEPAPSAPLQPAPPAGFEPGPSAPLQPAPVDKLKPIFANPIAPYTPDDKFAPIYSRPIAKIDPVVDTSTQKVKPLPPKGIAYIDPIFEPYTAARSSRIEQPISLNPVNELA